MRRQRGQAMVEYTVVLMALMAALLAPGLWPSSDQGGDGLVGLDQSRQGTLLRAIADKRRGFGYALSLAEIPEVDGADGSGGGSNNKLARLADYYDSLGKYPGLSAQLRQAGGKIDGWGQQLNDLNNVLSQLVPPRPPDPCDLMQNIGMPSIGGFRPAPPGCGQ